MGKRFLITPELLDRCRERLIEKDYSGIYSTFAKSGIISAESITKYFSSPASFLKVLNVPLCKLKKTKRYLTEEDCENLEKEKFYFRKYGYMKIIGSETASFHKLLLFKNNIKIRRSLITLYKDLCEYTRKPLDLMEFCKIYAMVTSASSRAKNQKVPFNLSVWDIYEMYDFEVPQECHVLKTPINYYNSKLFSTASPSLDKKNPSLGYVKNNVRIISHQANNWCSNMTKAQKLLIFKDALAEDEEVIIRKKKNTLLRKEN